MPRTKLPEMESEEIQDLQMEAVVPVGSPFNRLGAQRALDEAMKRMNADPELESIAVYSGCVTLKNGKQIVDVAIQLQLRKD